MDPTVIEPGSSSPVKDENDVSTLGEIWEHALCHRPERTHCNTESWLSKPISNELSQHRSNVAG